MLLMSRTVSNTIVANDFRARIGAFAELTKLRISVMVLFTFVVAGILAAGLDFDPVRMLYATIGMFLIAASGNAMNMYLERYTDLLMPRTANRPLPANRLGSTEVVLFAAISFGVSIGICLLYTSPSPRDRTRSRMPSSA